MQVAQELKDVGSAVYTAGPAAAEPGLFLPAASLCRRELVRFVRQRNRVIGALVTPIMFWLFIGAGMGRSFSAASLPGGGNYLQYFFPGTILMILLFTAIFSTISIIEDRHEGFLQSVLVAPVSRQSIVLGKVLGGTALAFGQGVIFLLLSPLIGIHLSLSGLLMVAVMMLVVGFSLTALGVCIAWRMASTQGFHAIMMNVLLPLWFLSGALFPPEKAWWGLKWLMLANPLTYGLAGIRQALYLGQPMPGLLPGLTACLVVSVVFAAVMFFLASAIVGGRVSADLQ
jgi:ABC-2 type transport system permease protein